MCQGQVVAQIPNQRASGNDSLSRAEIILTIGRASLPRVPIGRGPHCVEVTCEFASDPSPGEQDKRGCNMDAFVVDEHSDDPDSTLHCHVTTTTVNEP